MVFFAWPDQKMHLMRNFNDFLYQDENSCNFRNISWNYQYYWSTKSWSKMRCKFFRHHFSFCLQRPWLAVICSGFSYHLAENWSFPVRYWTPITALKIIIKNVERALFSASLKVCTSAQNLPINTHFHHRILPTRG